MDTKQYILNSLDSFIKEEYGGFKGLKKWVVEENILSQKYHVSLVEGTSVLERTLLKCEVIDDPKLEKFCKSIKKSLDRIMKDDLEFHSYKLHYFRTAPMPSKQPKSANRRSDQKENLESIKFANYLREKELTNKCLATWTKIAHETSSRSYSYGCLMRNMGKMAGVADYIFTMNNKVLWLELKDGKASKQSKDQKFFESWCLRTGSPYEVAFSAEEAMIIIEKHGFVLP